FSQRGWRSMRKSPFELFSYWQTRASTIGRSARAGNRFFRYARTSSRAAAVAFVGIERNAVRVVRDLEPAALEVGEAVIDVSVVEVRPAGKVLGLEPV